MIVFNKIGVIINGKSKDWNIVIQDDTQGETGGYYVIEWSPENENDGFDNWYESYEMLVFNLEEREIQWTDQDYVPKVPSEEEIIRVKEFQAMAKKKGF